MINKRLPAEVIVSMFLVLLILIPYLQMLNHDFVGFDDDKYVIENYHLSEGLTRKSITWAFTFTDNTYWHPLTWLSHMLDCQVYGLRPGMHHLTNLLLHIANSLLLFLILQRMTGALWKSAFVAALFALHPLNVDSVAWVSERKNVLSAFFWMLTMLTYAHYSERPGFLRYLVTLLAFTLGLMAKPTIAVCTSSTGLLAPWTYSVWSVG